MLEARNSDKKETFIVVLFLELLQLSLGSRQAISRPLTPAEWKDIYYMARRHTLVGVMFSVIERLPLAMRPPRLLMLEWYAETERIRSLNKRMNGEAVELTRRLQEDGWQGVILKGQGVALMYPDPLVRTPGDIDVYIKGNRADIIKYLRANSMSSPLITYKEAIYQIFSNTTVEVHFTPAVLRHPLSNTRLQRFIREQEASLFANSVSLPENVGKICIPTKYFNAVFLLTHIYRHLFGEGIGLRQVVDYYYLLEQGLTEQERSSAVEKLTQLKMLRFTRAMMYVLHSSLGLARQFLLVEPDEREGQLLLREIMRGGNFNRYEVGVSPVNESRLHRLARVSKANFHLLLHYPREVIFTPLFSIWQYLWRKYKGYC